MSASSHFDLEILRLLNEQLVLDQVVEDVVLQRRVSTRCRSAP